jgi:hypothetical protein
MLVRQRTAQILSFENLFTRNHGSRINVKVVNKLIEEDVENIFEQKHSQAEPSWGAQCKKRGFL